MCLGPAVASDGKRLSVGIPGATGSSIRQCDEEHDATPAVNLMRHRRSTVAERRSFVEEILSKLSQRDSVSFLK